MKGLRICDHARKCKVVRNSISPGTRCQHWAKHAHDTNCIGDCNEILGFKKARCVLYTEIGKKGKGEKNKSA